MSERFKHICMELAHHLPFTTFSVIAGMIIVALLTACIEKNKLIEISEQMFHIFHPVHVLFSASATTAMFWLHEKKLIKTILIGFFGSVLICGLSDAVIPYLGGALLRTEMEFHICLIQHPHFIIPFALFGILLGITSAEIIKRSFIYSHSIHVIVSAMASMLYLTSFGFYNWLSFVFPVFIILLLGVFLPCCISDIVFPLCFTKR